MGRVTGGRVRGIWLSLGYVLESAAVRRGQLQWAFSVVDLAAFFFAIILSIAIKIINMQHAACNIRQTTLACNRWGVFSVQDCRGGGAGGGAGSGACWSAGSIRGWGFIYFSFADAASLQIYEPHEQHVSMRQLQLQLQLHFVAINIIMRRLLAPISPAPLSLSCSPHEAKQIINLR